MGVSIPTGSLVRTGEERATLVRRTYSLVFVSVLVTIFGASFGLSQPALMQMVARHPFLTMIGVFAPLLMATRTRQQFPANIGFVLLFTFIEGIWISPILYIYGRSQPGLISEAAGLTVGAFAILTIYAHVTRRDWSAWGSFFVVGLFVLIGTMILNVFFRNQTADLWLAAGTVLIFSGLLVFDTWRLRNVYGPDDYLQAAVNIYLDLLNMFLAIIRLLGGRRS
ncbi:MAG: Bax inhibitor-1/YccA family protein [Gemmatimonadota bacterium]|nr:Bax inhibitor-1/YccA family protein [Gemmatimonadota bacterium]